MKKKIAVLLMLVILVGLLAGCGGKLSGTYVPVDDYYSEYDALTFKGNKVTFTTWGFDTSGTYKIKGDQITLKANFYGYEAEETLSFSKKGKSIFIDGEEYVRGKKPDSISAVEAVGAITGVSSQINRAKRTATTLLVIFLVVLPIIAIAVLVLMRKKIPWVDSTVDKVCAWAKKTFNKVADPETRAHIKEGAAKVGNKVSVGAGKAAAKVSSGVASGTAAFKAEIAKRQAAKGWKCPNCGTSNSPQSRFCTNCGTEKPADVQPVPVTVATEVEEFPEERRPAQAAPAQPKGPAQAQAPVDSTDSTRLPPARRSVTEDRCCVCGKPLDEEQVKLFDHPYGVEARLCKKCHTAMFILASGTDMNQFNNANRYLKHYIATADPVVEKSLNKFISKAEARIYNDMMGE